MKYSNYMLPFLLTLLFVNCNTKSEEGGDKPNIHDSFYNYIQLGSHGIGFCDSVIFNSKLRFDFLPHSGASYTQYDYSGPTPLFLQIWYPTEKETDSKPMSIGDYRNRNLSKALQSVYAPLCIKMDSFFVRYNIVESFGNYDSITYGEHSYFDILDTIKDFSTRSVKNKISEKLSFPVIVYHHGGQGLSDENFILAEYFASRGYIVISSNFHLPFENKMYGYEGLDFDDTQLPKSVIQFAKTITTNDQLYFVGHSAGAQVGFKFLYETNWANAFVSLETTLEGRAVEYLKSKEGWPELSNTISVYKSEFSIPILMLANTRKPEPFPLFDKLQAPLIQVSQKELFGHESYTSAYLMRYMYRDVFKQPDTKSLKNQLNLYVKQLELIEAFFRSLETSKNLNTEAFEEDFYFPLVNNSEGG